MQKAPFRGGSKLSHAMRAEEAQSAALSPAAQRAGHALLRAFPRGPEWVGLGAHVTSAPPVAWGTGVSGRREESVRSER